MIPHLRKNRNKIFSPLNMIVLCILLILASILFFYFATRNDEENDSPKLSPFYTPPLANGATYDFLTPLQSMNFPNAESTIVCIGNAPFSDSKDQPTGLANQIQKLTGATVYDCSIPNTYVSSYNNTFYPSYPYDAFSFYWLTTAFCVNNAAIYDLAYDNLNPIPNEAKESIELLFSIDFNTVDYLLVMYDGSDYLTGRPSSNPEKSTDIQTYAGALAAGIELVNAIYPHINIIVLGPSYLMAYDNSCAFADSMYYDYSEGNMPAYVSAAATTAATHNAVFIDNYFGTITSENAKDYLKDNLKLNEFGREAIAQKVFERFEQFMIP